MPLLPIGMRPVGNDKWLLEGVFDGNFNLVKAALEAGANVNGSPGQVLPPIVAATIAGHVGMVNFLLQQGADSDKPVTVEMATVTTPGQRSLHIAADSGKVEIVRLLLKRSRADPNATDNRGCTPLMVASQSPHEYVEVVRLLLEAGADPALAAEYEHIALHFAALKGHMNLVDMLHSTAPAMLNHCASTGLTALYAACSNGHESMVSKLLSLGAMQPMPLDDRPACPLVKAVERGFVGVVRILANAGGMRAVGGSAALGKAIYAAIQYRQARILQLLFALNRRWSEWAKTSRLLHMGAAYCCPGAVSVLLKGGADEAALDLEGRLPRDIIGLCLGREGIQMDGGKEVAIRRMLQRGPAYRARSWAWPSDEEPGAGGNGDGDTATAASAAASAAILSSPPAVKTPPVIGVRIFRPKEKGRSMFFARLVGRYCAKN